MAPRLPSAEDLGGPGSYSSGRGIVSYDVTPLAKGAKDLSAGAQQLGQAMLGAGLYKMKEEERTTTELGSARADANWMTELRGRIAAKRLYDPDVVRERWPEAKARLLRDGENADLSDLEPHRPKSGKRERKKAMADE